MQSNKKLPIEFPIKSGKNHGFLGCNYLLSKQRSDKKSIKYAIIGLPFDSMVTNRKGAKYAPKAIRQASLMLCDAYHPDINTSTGKPISPILPHSKIIDLGDVKMPSNIHQIHKKIEQEFNKLIGKYHLLAIGGDHSITLPILRSHFLKAQKPLALIHFDAHCDTWHSKEDNILNHANWLYQAHQQGLIDIAKTVQIGIRSPGESKFTKYVANNGGLIISSRQLRGLDGKLLKPIINLIKKKIKNHPVYLTLDIDILDPAFAPGTGTPEAGGISTSQLLTLIEGLNLNYLGFDCVEVNPQYDHSEITSLAAAQILWAYLCNNIKATS